MGRISLKPLNMREHKAEHTWGGRAVMGPARGDPHLRLFPKLDPAPRVSACNQKCVPPQLGTLRFKRPDGLCPNPISKPLQPHS